MQLMYPWFLAGLLAVSIPIIIHLLQLRRPQRILFSNTAFIREVELVTVRHRKIQSWWILLMRVLAVCALVLVFCQPFIPAKVNGVSGNTAGADVLVDNSFSMQQQSAEQTSLLEEAKDEASTLGKSAATGTKLRLINRGNQLLTPAAFLDHLDELTLSSRIPLTKLTANNSGSTHSVFLLSDFQRSSFNSKSIDALDNKWQVVLIPLASRRSANVYIDSVWLDDAFVRVRTNVGLHVRLKNGGSVTASNCPVKVFLGTKQVGAFQVTVEPGKAVASVLQVQANDQQLVMGRVVTEDAPVTFDNTYYFTIQPAATIRVIEIGPEPVAQQLYANEPLFTYSFFKPQGVNYGAMRQANMVLVREVKEVDAGLRDGLKAVLKRGGSVVVVPTATPTGHASYQNLFKELGLGTVQWEANAQTPELREVAMPNPRESFFRDVFGAQQRTVTMPRVAPVLRWSRTGTDILRLRDGESYLANFTSGKGRVYVFSAPFASQYSDFVAHALFVPVMYRMAMLSYRNEQLPAYRLTQTTMNLQLPEVAGAQGETARGRDEAGFRLVKDSLTMIPAQRVIGQELKLDLPAAMDAPGFYQLQRRGKVLTTLAFNQDKKESELASYSPEELRELIGPNRPNIKVLETSENGGSLASFQAEQTGQPLWRYFLALALLCLLGEALLVRFGNRRSVTPAIKVAA